MGLAIDGNEVHGIARGGQAFVPYSNKLCDFAKATFGTKIYFSSKALIGETDVNNGHFMVAFQYASDKASSYDDFSDCRIVGATYISEDNVDTTTMKLNAGAGLYYLFSVYSYNSDAASYYPKGEFLLRADQVVFKSSSNSDSSMMS